jgi:hypothetical protein
MMIVSYLGGEIDRIPRKKTDSASGSAAIGFSSHADHASRHRTVGARRSPSARILGRHSILMTIITNGEVTS